MKLAPAVPKFFMVQQIRDLQKEGRLDLHPFFQRQLVWPEKFKAYLVDSIIRGYPVPEVFLRFDEARKVYETIDGQQRLGTILDFLAGGFEVEHDGRWCNFDALPADARKQVLEYPITVRELKEIDEETVREIFQRLNTNVVLLVPQELRHAKFSGPFIRLIEELGQDPYWTESGVITKMEATRMRAPEYVSELIVAMKEKVQNGRYHLTGYYASYEAEFTAADAARWKKSFLETLGSVKLLFPDIGATSWRKKGDFYSLFLSLYGLAKEGLKLDPDSVREVQADLLLFRKKVERQPKEPIDDPDVIKYTHAIGGGTNQESARLARIEIITRMVRRRLQPKVGRPAKTFHFGDYACPSCGSRFYKPGDKCSTCGYLEAA